MSVSILFPFGKLVCRFPEQHFAPQRAFRFRRREVLRRNHAHPVRQDFVGGKIVSQIQFPGSHTPAHDAGQVGRAQRREEVSSAQAQHGRHTRSRQVVEGFAAFVLVVGNHHHLDGLFVCLRGTAADQDFICLVEPVVRSEADRKVIGEIGVIGGNGEDIARVGYGQNVVVAELAALEQEIPVVLDEPLHGVLNSLDVFGNGDFLDLLAGAVLLLQNDDAEQAEEEENHDRFEDCVAGAVCWLFHQFSTILQ